MPAQIKSKIDADVSMSAMMPIALNPAPPVVGFWVSGFCNFTCNYCLHALKRGSVGRRGIIEANMNFDLFRHIADGLSEFSVRPMAATFCGIGEPLMNSALPEMIAYLKRNRLVRAVELTTNGALLTHALTKALIESGVDMIVVSAQGTSAERYEDVCGSRIDMERFLGELSYLYEHKNACTVHIKTVDAALVDEADKVCFFEMFGGACDSLYVERAVPLFQEMRYEGDAAKLRNQFTGEPVQLEDVSFCPLIFTSLHFLPDGGISSCPLATRPALLGNARDMTPREAWESRDRLLLLLEHARGHRASISACAHCVEPCMIGREEDMPPSLAGEIEAALAQNK